MLTFFFGINPLEGNRIFSCRFEELLDDTVYAEKKERIGRLSFDVYIE